MQHYYSLDLASQFKTAGCRRLWALVRGLPPDCAFRREGRAWTQSDELAALAIEHADRWGRILAIGQGRKPEKVPETPRIQHPDRPKLDRHAKREHVRRLSVADFQREYQQEVTR